MVTRGYQPMVGAGVDTDILQNGPALWLKEQADDANAEAVEDTTRQQSSRLLTVLSDLQGAGSPVVQRLLRNAMNRVQVLAHEDPELRLIFSLLGEVFGPEILGADRIARESVLHLCMTYLHVSQPPPGG